MSTLQTSGSVRSSSRSARSGARKRSRALEATAIERLGEDLAFGLGGDVLHDAEQVARIDAVGKRVGAALALEDGEAVDDGV